MVDITFQVSDLSTLFSVHKLLTKNSYPQIIKVVLHSKNIQSYGNMVRDRKASSRVALLNHLTKQDVNTTANGLPHVFDAHVIQNLFPKNITFLYVKEYEKEYYFWKHASVEGCPKQILVPGKLRPFLYRDTQSSLGLFKEIGLAFQTEQLRFVSCHKERPNWIFRLNDLIFAFDTPTWLLIFTVLVGISKFLGFCSNSLKSCDSLGFWLAFYSLLTSMMDQSSRIFRLNSERARVLLCFLPLMFLVLGNEYKGENITNLTVEPNLVPFDTFKGLVKNGFDIRSRRIILSNIRFLYLKENTQVDKDFVQENGHEGFPLVSELWYAITTRFSYEQQNRLEALKDKFSRNTWFYLNHSEMLPVWKNKSGNYGSLESTQQVIHMHMGKCDKTAMILPKYMALQLFNTLKAAKQPVFFGKDIISENLFGYTYYGYFPPHILLKIRFSYSSGLVEWWRSYIKWFLVLKAYNNFATGNVTGYDGLENGEVKNGSGSKVYILCIIPGFGLLISLTIFICHDCGAIKGVLFYLRRLLRLVKLWRKPKSFIGCCCCGNQEITRVKRFSWPDILSK